MNSAPSSATWPTLSVLFGAVVSGLTWLPLHAAAEAGIGGLWITLAVVIFAALPLLPLLPAVCRLRGRDFKDVWWIGLLIGVEYAFYTASLTTTEVARAILLFYIAPVWGTLLEVGVLRQKLTLRRVLSLVLGGAGLAAIFGIGLGFDLTVRLGDILALLSGILWSIGLLFVFKRGGKSGVGAQSSALAMGALLGAVVMALLLEPAPAPDLGVLLQALPWLVVGGVIFILPVWVITIWAGRRITPTRTTIIFMAEVCVGVGSAALWAGDDFGWRETAGTILVLAAAAVEFLPAPVSKDGPKDGQEDPALAPDRQGT
jgi:drug/metabolite transporter (DMT)-like permease